MNLFRALCSIFLLLLGLLALGLGVQQSRRNAVESQSPEALAPKQGHWFRPGDGSEIFYQAWGPESGPVILITHGTGAWSGTWFGLPSALAARGWRVVAMDLPPFGFSSVGPRGDYTRSAQAARVLALIDELNAPPLVIMGHSFGSGPALEAAMLGGSRARSLILVDPALGLGSAGEAPDCPRIGLTDTLLAQRALRTAALSALVTEPAFGAHWLKAFVHRKEAVTPESLRPYQAPFPRQGLSAAFGDWASAFSRAGCEGAPSLRPQALSAWSRSGPPLTLIWGEQDSITPLAQAKALQGWMPKTRLITIPGAGHIPHLETPEAFERALISALPTP